MASAARHSPAAAHPPYVPPYPPRHRTEPGPLALIRRARFNLLDIWPEQAFGWQFFGGRLLLRHVFVANSPDTVQHVFVERADNYQAKSPQQRHALKPLIGDGLFISDGDTWAERRRMVAPVTHISRVPALAPTITEVAGEWAERWAGLPEGATLDVLQEMAHLTAVIICRTIFGRHLPQRAMAAIVAGFSEFQASVGQMDVLSLMGLPDMVPRLHGRRARRSAKAIRGELDRLIADILDGDPGEPSLVRAMAGTDSPVTGRPMTRDAIRNEAAVLFMAGHETTANTLAWAWFLLSQAPWAEAAVLAEVAALGGRPATNADMGRLPYTRAVIQETLRLYPPIPFQARQAKADDTVRRRRVPSGSLVILVPWLLHRHRDLWERPDEFVPERWLEGGSGLPSRYAYVPFSIGPRICPGASFATVEAVICLATLIGRVRLRLPEGERVEPVCRLSLRPGEALPMRVERRT